MDVAEARLFIIEMLNVARCVVISLKSGED
jgi:hypothetical protein